MPLPNFQGKLAGDHKQVTLSDWRTLLLQAPSLACLICMKNSLFIQFFSKLF